MREDGPVTDPRRMGTTRPGTNRSQLLHERYDRPTDTERLIEILTRHGLFVSVMESLTGGMVLSELIAVPNASACVAGGAIAYTDGAKIRMGVPQDIITQFGAVSAQCAEAMAAAVRLAFGTDIGLSTTGFAGPTGGTANNPVGTYFVAGLYRAHRLVRRYQVHSDRQGVRTAASLSTLQVLWDLLDS